MFKKVIAIATILGSISAAGIANAETYRCAFPTVGSATKFLSPEVTIKMGQGDSATVSSAHTQQYLGGPASGKITNNTAKRITVKWTIKAPRINASYSLSIRPSSLGASMNMLNPPAGRGLSFTGASGNQSANGKCSKSG